MGEIAYLAGVAFLGALVFGFTGFGAALVTIPLATHVVPLQFALALFVLVDLACAASVGFEKPKNAVRAAGVVVVAPSSDTLTACNPVGEKPSSTWCRCTTERASSRAEAASTKASVTSAPTSQPRARAEARVPTAPRVPASAAAGARRVQCSGSRLAAASTATAATTANATT